MHKLAPGSFKVVPGRNYETPKELWGFRSKCDETSALRIARAFLEANRKWLGIEVDPLFRNKVKVLHGLSADHVILQQRYQRRRVHRAYVTVHISRDGHVYLVKSRAAPAEVLAKAKAARVSEQRAVRIALARVRGRSQTSVVGTPELMWYPARKLLHPAWRVRVHRTKPRGEFLIHVNAESGSILECYDNLAALVGKGCVFAPNPMARARNFRPLDAEGSLQRPPWNAYEEVKLYGLKGNHHLDGKRVSTRLTKQRVRARDHDFRCEHHRPGFEEVSAYYHVDRAIAYLEAMGYRGKRRIFRKPFLIDARGTREDNAWYSPGRRSLTFGLGEIDEAEDGETVLHEFGHALQDFICPDFGQSVEAAAMGEGFGDYLAGSFFEKRKPELYRLSVISWDGAYFPGNPPAVRRLDSQHSYESFNHARGEHEHENGEIWSAALWEVRALLGRRRADEIIVDSHFQLDGFTSFARGARAILDADRNLHRGRNQEMLRDVFRRRGIGPVE